MADPLLRDPVPPEPEKRRGPQKVRAAKPSVTPSPEQGTGIPTEEVPVNQVPMEQTAAESAPDMSPAPAIDAPAVDLPNPPPTSPLEPGQVSGEASLNAELRIPGPTSETGAVAIDPARELPPPSTTAPERPPATRRPATAIKDFDTVRTPRKRAASARPPKGRTPAQEMLDELRPLLQELIGRVEQQATASAVSLRRELTQDAEYAKIRARYYHLRRPLQALGAVAAGGFFFGLFLGLWRR